jgi:hypothetical protein
MVHYLERLAAIYASLSFLPVELAHLLILHVMTAFRATEEQHGKGMWVFVNNLSGARNPYKARQVSLLP